MAFVYWRRVVGTCEIVDFFKRFLFAYIATLIILQFVEIDFN